MLQCLTTLSVNTYLEFYPMQLQVILPYPIIRHQRDQRLHLHSPSRGSYKQQREYPSVSQSKTNIVCLAVPLKSCPLALSPSFLLSFGYIPVFLYVVVLLTPELQSTWDEAIPKLTTVVHFLCPVSYTVLCAPQKTIDCLANSLPLVHILPLKILPSPRKSIWSEQLKTTTYFPRHRPISFTVSVFPVPAGPTGAPPMFMPNAWAKVM